MHSMKTMKPMKTMKTMKTRQQNTTTRQKTRPLLLIKNVAEDLPSVKRGDICIPEAEAFQSFEEEFGRDNPKLVGNGVESYLIKMFKQPFAPKALKPVDDFYGYINYTWLTTTAKEAKTEKHYYAQIDDFRIVQDLVYHEIMETVKTHVKEHKQDRRAILIGRVCKSLLTLDSGVIKQRIQTTLKQQEEYYTKGNLWEFMGHICTNEIVSWGCPFNWQVMVDERRPSTFSTYILPPQLGLYDSRLYMCSEVGETPEYIRYKHEVQREYRQYIDNVFRGCGVKGSCSDVWEAERLLLLAMECDAPTRHRGTKSFSEEYSVVQSSTALADYGFDFPTFARTLGYNPVPQSFVSGDIAYLSCICRILQHKDAWKSTRWRTYFIFIYLRQLIRFDANLIHIYYDFNGKYLRGMPVVFPRDIYPVFGLSLTFNTFLTSRYIAQNYSEQRVNYVRKLAVDLLVVFGRIVKRNTWMSPSCKAAALLKLKHMKLTIAQPRELEEDPLLEYSSSDAWGNMLLITDFRRKHFVELSGQVSIDTPNIDWSATPWSLNSKQSYVVNAMYTPGSNEIYIPLGYIRPPFVDLSRHSLEYNLARIGFTLAHEMSHALDDLGSQYNYKGDKVEWWTPEDKRKYDAIQNDIIKQYEVFAKRDGIVFDAAMTIGEDVADISGLAICQEYMRDYHEKYNIMLPAKEMSYKTFYMHFASQNRQHVYKEAIAAQLKTNPHPLDKYRTNIPLSRSNIFRSVYNVKKGDDMYWHSTSTIF